MFDTATSGASAPWANSRPKPWRGSRPWTRRRCCPYCIEVHRKAATAAGATEAELAETVRCAPVSR
ncbi:MAG TPA: carboxymuconolactone decarboxylase family protein [Acetobacteraceae bacterium]|nr:carboxymuconolactone decarboxylase family protein [Acetobacteraceae bacterium]